MEIAIYIHIPYCLQRCRYCDFTTFEWNQILPPEEYVRLVKTELARRHPFVPGRRLTSIYFGGGTPSLLSAESILDILAEIANVGFEPTPQTEITIEINPATLTREKLDLYLQSGINRFSVGAQTFNDRLLTQCGRKHSADDTRKTLDLLALKDLNYSFDLLFALPGQNLKDLRADLVEVSSYAPRHLSAYCLTVPEGHPMSQGRPLEDEQIAMFDLIEERLSLVNLKKYEISNFAQPGFESRHNGAYWSDQAYWGVGLSSHSYFPLPQGGFRFWNPKGVEDYRRQVLASNPAENFYATVLAPEQKEALARHEALTDYLHTFLRTTNGLPLSALRKKWGPRLAAVVESRTEPLIAAGYLEKTPRHWRLTRRGQLLSNLVFGELLMGPEDMVDHEKSFAPGPSLP